MDKASLYQELSTPEGQKWLPTAEGMNWLRTKEGYDWRQTLDGKKWLNTFDGNSWTLWSSTFPGKYPPCSNLMCECRN